MQHPLPLLFRDAVQLKWPACPFLETWRNFKTEDCSQFKCADGGRGGAVTAECRTQETTLVQSQRVCRLSVLSDISIRQGSRRRNYLSPSIVRAAIVIRVKWTSEVGALKEKQNSETGIGGSAAVDTCQVVIDSGKVDRQTRA